MTITNYIEITKLKGNTSKIQKTEFHWFPIKLKDIACVELLNSLSTNVYSSEKRTIVPVWFSITNLLTHINSLAIPFENQLDEEWTNVIQQCIICPGFAQ